MEEFEGPHGNYTPEIGPLHVNYVLKCIWWKQLEVAHENICCVNALPMQTLWQIFKKKPSWSSISFSTLEKSHLYVNHVLKRFFSGKCTLNHFLCKKKTPLLKLHKLFAHWRKNQRHVNYVIKRFLVEMTWRCTWEYLPLKSLSITGVEEIVTNS